MEYFEWHRVRTETALDGCSWQLSKARRVKGSEVNIAGIRASRYRAPEWSAPEVMCTHRIRYNKQHCPYVTIVGDDIADLRVLEFAVRQAASKTKSTQGHNIVFPEKIKKTIISAIPNVKELRTYLLPVKMKHHRGALLYIGAEQSMVLGQLATLARLDRLHARNCPGSN